MFCSNNYYIKKLPQNPVNTNKYIYVDSIDGNLIFDHNYWVFDLNFYVIQNLNLPLNIFNINLENNFFSLTEQNINITQKQIPYWVVQQDNCAIYHTNFLVDISQTKMLETELEKYLINLYFSFDINLDILNKIQIDLDQDELDKFVLEWYEQNKIIKFEYSNFYSANETSGNINITKSYYLNSYEGCYAEDEILYYSEKDYQNIDEAINNLLEIKVDEATINSWKCNFFYQTYDSLETKQLTIENKDQQTIFDNFKISFGYATYFNEQNNELILTESGILGFYIPIKCSGYYEIEIDMYLKNQYKKFKFINKFNFIGNDQYSINKFNIKNAWINSLEGFNKI